MEDDLSHAITMAFVFVAAADGELSSKELERFVGWACDHRDFAGVERAELAARFGDAAAQFRADFEAAQAEALAAVRTFRDNKAAGDLITEATGIAVVADEALRDVEETAVDQVKRALGRA